MGLHTSKVVVVGVPVLLGLILSVSKNVFRSGTLPKCRFDAIICCICWSEALQLRCFAVVQILSPVYMPCYVRIRQWIKQHAVQICVPLRHSFQPVRQYNASCRRSKFATLTRNTYFVDIVEGFERGDVARPPGSVLSRAHCLPLLLFVQQIDVLIKKPTH
jgi:hypothetical protein